MKRIASLCLALTMTACVELPSKEVSGHIYHSVLINLNKQDDAELFNLASLAMSDGVMSEKEAKKFFDYAQNNSHPVIMAPVFRNAELKEAYPQDENRSKLQNFFDNKQQGK